MKVKEALHVILKEEHLGDWIYDVRDRARESDLAYKDNSWKHPRVTRFSEAVAVLEKYLEEA